MSPRSCVDDKEQYGDIAVSNIDPHCLMVGVLD